VSLSFGSHIVRIQCFLKPIVASTKRVRLNRLIELCCAVSVMQALRFGRLSWLVFRQGSKAFQSSEAVVQLDDSYRFY